MLPVHDSFIVQKRCKRELIDVMKHEFEAFVGVAASVKVVPITSDERKEREARDAMLSHWPNDPIKRLAGFERV